MAADDEMGLADEILASPVHERQKEGRGFSAVGSRAGGQVSSARLLSRGKNYIKFKLPKLQIIGMI
jgi:hypothetical protein